MIGNRTRIAAVLDQAIKNLLACRSMILTVHTANGDAYELNPASMSELVVLDEHGKVKCRVNAMLMLKPDSKERIKAKESLNIMGYGQALMDILREHDGALIFSPTEMLGLPGEIYGSRPMFVSCGISERHAIKLLVDYMAFLTPKSTLATVNALQNDQYFTRQHVIKLINNMGRALSPLASEFRRLMFSECRTWHNDESTWRCLELLRAEDSKKKRKKGKKRGRNYIWTLVTGKHEQRQGVAYLAAKDRSCSSFMRQFGVEYDDKAGTCNPPPDFSLAIENLVTDGYPGYRKGEELLENLLKRQLRRGCCFSHARQYALETLQVMGLHDVFLKICTGTAVDYQQRLDAELKASGVSVARYGQKVLLMSFLIELILRLDHRFARMTREELEERRKKISSVHLRQLYSLAAELLAESPTIKQSGDYKGMPQYEGGKDLPWGKFICYLLNNRREFGAFIEDGDIECQNNWAEVKIRGPVRHRSAMEFFETYDGFRAYADAMTIFETCRLNDVNVYDYLLWAIANAKLRLDEYRLTKYGPEHQTSRQLLRPPKREDENGEKLDSLYDEKCVCCFDMISWKGLDVWTYKQLLDEEMPRIKPEYLED